ncbi:MAG: hypothetical protein IKO32_07800 [Lachnospiraceae bacterium]|nr:hypothetical protein [Lachnospiraceae bacterium]
MRNLIHADLRRVLRRPTIYVFAGLMQLFVIFAGYSDDAFSQMNTEKNVAAYMVAIMASVPILITLYGDDFKAGSIITLIGRGLSRTKIMLSKLIVSAILLLFYYLIALGECMIFHTFLIEAFYSPKQQILTVVMFFLMWFRNVALFAFSSILMYALWSVAGGLITMLGLIVFTKIILSMLFQNSTFNIYDLTLSGLIDKAYSSLLSGGFPFQLILAVIYFVVFLIIGNLFFKRKELDL